ncbi:hypothetical protein EDB89DRAFT_1554992 [Lactarius sanguifluus]|nr:hypothetical protein EDB89DRAFT_1554992 [Lactarius sanguifluus]
MTGRASWPRYSRRGSVGHRRRRGPVERAVFEVSVSTPLRSSRQYPRRLLPPSSSRATPLASRTVSEGSVAHCIVPIPTGGKCKLGRRKNKRRQRCTQEIEMQADESLCSSTLCSTLGCIGPMRSVFGWISQLKEQNKNVAGAKAFVGLPRPSGGGQASSRHGHMGMTSSHTCPIPSPIPSEQPVRTAQHISKTRERRKTHLVSVIKLIQYPSPLACDHHKYGTSSIDQD